MDPSIATSVRGMWALKWSFVALVGTALLQVVVVGMSGSVALLADTIHKFPVPPRRFHCGGRLRWRATIRGISRDVAVVFSFRPVADGRSAALAGGTTIRRLDFGVGQGEWQDTKWIGNDVRVEFELVLEPGTERAGATRGQAAPTPGQPTAAVLKPGAA